MSRTFRRRNYEQTQNSSWYISPFGYYHKYDWDSFNGSLGRKLFRECTEAEYFKKYWNVHADRSFYPYCRPGMYTIAQPEAVVRARNNQELNKWKKNHDYEPMCISKARFDYYD